MTVLKQSSFLEQSLRLHLQALWTNIHAVNYPFLDAVNMKPHPAVAANILHVRIWRLVAYAVFVPHLRVWLQLLLINVEAWPGEVNMSHGHSQFAVFLHWDDSCLGLDALNIEVYLLFRGEDLGLWYEVSVVGQDVGGQVGFLVDSEDLNKASGVFGVAFGSAFEVTYSFDVVVGGFDDFAEMCV